jgi:hypothetical protein
VAPAAAAGGATAVTAATTSRNPHCVHSISVFLFFLLLHVQSVCIVTKKMYKKS